MCSPPSILNQAAKIFALYSPDHFTVVQLLVTLGLSVNHFSYTSIRGLLYLHYEYSFVFSKHCGDFDKQHFTLN